MYIPSFRVKRNGVPILSGKEIDAIGNRFIADFQPEVLSHPAPVNIEAFIECYLGMTQDYQFLSHNGIYLGMTVFNDTNRVVVFSPQTNRAEYISAKARTVIIDNRLLADNQQHRYRFTLGHEGGHDIFHSAYYSYNPAQLTMDNTVLAPMIQCRVDNQTARKKPTTWDDHDWMEWQANRFSSALLMPEDAVRSIADKYVLQGKLKNPANIGMLVAKISGIFDVSVTAAAIRLKDLGYISKNDSSDYSSGSALMDFAEVVAI